MSLNSTSAKSKTHRQPLEKYLRIDNDSLNRSLFPSVESRMRCSVSTMEWDWIGRKRKRNWCRCLMHSCYTDANRKDQRMSKSGKANTDGTVQSLSWKILALVEKVPKKGKFEDNGHSFLYWMHTRRLCITQNESERLGEYYYWRLRLLAECM